jgi:hypothetical protein
VEEEHTEGKAQQEEEGQLKRTSLLSAMSLAHLALQAILFSSSVASRSQLRRTRRLTGSSACVDRGVVIDDL